MLAGVNDISATSLQEIEPYEGPHQIPGIRFRPAAAALGVTAWGMNVLEFDPGCTGHPEHDHQADGQEEVYFAVRGSVTLIVGEHEVAVEEGQFVRVPPALTRKLIAGPNGATILAIGAIPGKAYKSMF